MAIRNQFLFISLVAGGVTLVSGMATVLLLQTISGFANPGPQEFFLIVGITTLAAASTTYGALHFFYRRFANSMDMVADLTSRIAGGDKHARIESQLPEPFSSMADQLNRLAETLVRNDKARKQWIADTSHEMRTPIAVLRAQIEAFQDGVQKITPKTLSVLHAEIMSLNKLVDDINWLARFDIGLVTPELVPTDISSTLQEVVEAVSERFQTKQLSIDTTGIKTGLIVNGDAGRLRRLFNNLMENSFFYTDPGGKLSVSCQSLIEPGADDGTRVVLIHLDDSEPGVPQEFMPQIFDRFFRVDKSRNKSLGGSGLGLAISKKIVESHFGTIDASPSPLGGVRMVIRLPITKELQGGS